MTPPQIPFSVTGRSTIFGLNFDGSIDRGDNGEGAFGDNTRDKNLIGCSLPIPVLAQSIGDDHAIRLRHYTVSIYSHITSQSLSGVWIVDKGPATWTGNAIDLTYGATLALGHHDNGLVTYWITGTSGIVQIRGWNWLEHTSQS